MHIEKFILGIIVSRRYLAMQLTRTLWLHDVDVFH